MSYRHDYTGIAAGGDHAFYAKIHRQADAGVDLWQGRG